MSKEKQNGIKNEINFLLYTVHVERRSSFLLHSRIRFRPSRKVNRGRIRTILKPRILMLQHNFADQFLEKEPKLMLYNITLLVTGDEEHPD